jgi:hypothetical protein
MQSQNSNCLAFFRAAYSNYTLPITLTLVTSHQRTSPPKLTRKREDTLLNLPSRKIFHFSVTYIATLAINYQYAIFYSHNRKV